MTDAVEAMGACRELDCGFIVDWRKVASVAFWGEEGLGGTAVREIAVDPVGAVVQGHWWHEARVAGGEAGEEKSRDGDAGELRGGTGVVEEEGDKNADDAKREESRAMSGCCADWG